MAALFVVAVVTAKRAPMPAAATSRALRNALAITLAACAASLAASVMLDVPLVAAAGQFMAWNLATVCVYVAL